MTTFKIYKLFFTAPLHIGDQHEDGSFSMRTIQSDTLYAALTSCLAKTGNTIPDDGDLGVTVSSLFPYYQQTSESRSIYFLPMPLQCRQPELEDVSMAKKLKKVQWVDSTLYGNILNGTLSLTNADTLLPYIQGIYLTKEKLPLDEDGSCEFIKSEMSQRVTLKSRTGQEDAKPYYVDKIVFRHHAGFFFIAEGNTTLLDKALNFLAMEGVGTDRNIGFGYFEYSVDSIALELPQEANHQLSLSLLIPDSEEQMAQLMASDRVAYDFIRRGGWITTYPYTTIRKCAIYGFLPGSVFKKSVKSGCEPTGRIINLIPEIGELTPDHPIWRNGRSIMLPIKLT